MLQGQPTTLQKREICAPLHCSVQHQTSSPTKRKREAQKCGRCDTTTGHLSVLLLTLILSISFPPPVHIVLSHRKADRYGRSRFSFGAQTHHPQSPLLPRHQSITIAKPPSSLCCQSRTHFGDSRHLCSTNLPSEPSPH